MSVHAFPPAAPVIGDDPAAPAAPDAPDGIRWVAAEEPLWIPAAFGAFKTEHVRAYEGAELRRVILQHLELAAAKMSWKDNGLSSLYHLGFIRAVVAKSMPLPR